MAEFREARRVDLSGIGVTVTQVCPGPVESEFDQVAGSPAEMIGIPRLLRITAAQCAREAVASFERGDTWVFRPAYRFDENDAAIPVVVATQAGRRLGCELDMHNG